LRQGKASGGCCVETQRREAVDEAGVYREALAFDDLCAGWRGDRFAYSGDKTVLDKDCAPGKNRSADGDDFRVSDEYWRPALRKKTGSGQGAGGGFKELSAPYRHMDC
jgi:hypothetical protein